MQVLDLFNTKFERDLTEGAVDNTVARLIEPLSQRAADIRTQLRSGNLDASEIKNLEREYEDLVNKRLDIIHGRGPKQEMDEVEGGIGQDLVTPQQRVQQSTPQKQTPVQKVGSTVKHAANWLAGRGGPGKEGPTYEGAGDIENRGEYDQEGDMAKDNIHTIVRNAHELESILGDNDNLPEWVQDKLANIKGMMTAVSEYMQTQHERDHEEGVAIAEKLKGLPTKKLGSARDLGKSVKKFRAQRGLEEAGTDSQWSKESGWKAVPKAKSGKPVDPRGEVTHLSDVARREAEREADQKKNPKEVDEGLWGGSGPAGLKTPYAVYTKQNGQVKRVKTTNKIGQPMNTREAEAYVAAMRKSDPARWTHDTVWVGPADHDLDEEQKPYNPNEFRPVGPITIVPPRKLKSGETHQGINDYWKAQGQAPIYKTNEAGSPAQQAAIAIAMKRAGKKPKQVDEELDAVDENLRDWFGKEKWVRMDTKGNIKGDCARGSESEGKPKCLPQAKAHALGKKGRASAAQKKRREDPNPERRGKAINVATKVKEDDLDEACWKGYHKDGMKTMFGKRYPNCIKNKNESLEVYVNRGECPGCGGVMVAEDQINEKQDACYHKVKSRYKVWPSAYASGALVQCRKKGAANWGNKSESVVETYTDVIESQGITDPKLLEVARRIDAFAKELK